MWGTVRYKLDLVNQIVKVVLIDHIGQRHPGSNTNYTVNEIHEILNSYYKVTRKRFADNLHMQTVDFHLVNGPSSPLRLFNPSFVGRLSECQLVEIAGKDEALIRRRATLNRAIKILRKAKRILS